MTTLIDQRILVPAPAHVVWAVLADSNQLPQWRVDCHTVSVLTPRQFGVGMRRLCTPERGRAHMEEIIAWYEGLGYEYHYIEDRRYTSWVGRLRLQAVPEGTIVQWTINYRNAGIIGRFLNRLGGKAQNEEDTTNSLRQLRRLLESQGYTANGETRRRQTLQPVPSIVRSSTQPISVPPEVSAADTKPRKPEGLQEAVQQMLQPTQTTPIPTPTETTPPADPTLESALPPGMPESLKATPPQGTPKVDLSRVRYADEIDDAAPEEENLQATQIIRPGLPPPSTRDTGNISIWEAFGVKAPSQLDNEALAEVVKHSTGEHKTLKIEPALRESDTRTFSPLYEVALLRVRAGFAAQPARQMRVLKVRERK